ncbi:thermonuclease family protein [Nocardioides currus]|uniref:TNase-like domain-containing protein n=1 Tax=Nocardioides currus TaxID=2133958 RepID=A0A2R7YSU6_9ACTN|nr:thermonuclease family protein [Nocardioides currus]PUA79465.1 hypothetical protein C7S10_19025 [Nocardioides currus]
MKILIGLLTAGLAIVATAGGLTPLLDPHPGPSAAAEGRATQVRVTDVLDGDTLRVADLAGNDLGRVRLLGIDAPEIAHPPAAAECYADRATAELEQLTPIGATFTLTTDTGQPNRDRYGRMLRYVDRVDQPGEPDHAGEVDEASPVDVARELLATGAARRYETRPALARESTYTTATTAARSASRGLWGHC